MNSFESCSVVLTSDGYRRFQSRKICQVIIFPNSTNVKLPIDAKVVIVYFSKATHLQFSEGDENEEP